jgi:hypothetical protein
MGRSNCNAFVEFLVGPEQVSFIIHKDKVMKRDYWSNRHHGFFRLKGKEGLSIDLPGLDTINPDDFKFVAEYLCDGEFGHRENAINDENRSE